VTFGVQFDCRGCSDGDDERYLLHRPGDEDGDSGSGGNSNIGMRSIDMREYGPVEPECVCDRKYKTNRGPTSYEFSSTLQRILLIRIREGKISVLTKVGWPRRDETDVDDGTTIEKPNDDDDDDDSDDTATPTVTPTATPTVCDVSHCPHVLHIDYVCGSDGKTYDNESALDCANYCITDVNDPNYVTMVGKGRCGK